MREKIEQHSVAKMKLDYNYWLKVYLINWRIISQGLFGCILIMVAVTDAKSWHLYTTAIWQK